ncbi:hypothetical protein IV203_029411 [Nitzschia inconspicua]|uniref:PDZ domain-containing protein n=1 Tax=Nitzschia inconspicua TaxID=303405 RepID=A0A9K3LTE9_9STRA|nr:hypothetical protein IV203_029411 [Nitzschia inconspicua]
MMNFSLASLLVLLLCYAASTTDGQIVIDPWTTQLSNAPYPQQYVLVGETIVFIWPEGEEQNVWIYPSRVCFDDTDRRFVGSVPGVNYTFTEGDGSPTGNTLLFTSDVDDNCVNGGMRLRVTVYSDTDTLPPFVTPPTSSPPVSSPTVDVTISPSSSPTDSVVTEETAAPTEVPTTVSATDAPTETPVAPTLPPVAPTLAPTTTPPVATPMPTSVPTELAATEDPTFALTVVPTTTTATKNITLRGLEMELFGINQFGRTTQESWMTTTASYSTLYVQQQFGGIVSMFETIYTVTDSTIIVTQAPGKRQVRRNLQQQDISGDSVKITYTQTLIYDTSDPAITSNFLAEDPFDTEENRVAYVNYLRNNANNLPLSRVVGSTAVTVASPGAPSVSPPTPEPTMAPFLPPSPTQNGNDDNESFLSLPAIIGIACGGGALLILFIIYCLYCRSGGLGKNSKKDAKSTSTPPMTVSVNRDDEVSTLHDLKHMNGHGGDQSIATVDYDYSKAYGGGDNSVSSAGGTLGDRTNNFSAIDPSHAAATGATLGPFDDDASFENHYRAPGSNVKEEVLHVFAPPGKLGVVIDTPDNGAPIVHAVKETSAIYGRVRVGDKLVAVDDEDCRTMTAVKVSKLISRKSANPSRKLTIVRTTTVD